MLIESITFFGAICAAAYAAVRLDESLRLRRAMAQPRKGPAVRLVSQSALQTDSWWAQYDEPTCWRRGTRPETIEPKPRRKRRTKIANARYEVVA